MFRSVLRVLSGVLLLVGCSACGFLTPFASPAPATSSSQAVHPRFTAVAFATPRIGWMAGTGIIWGTLNGGLTWQVQWRGAQAVAALDILNATTVWAVTRAPSSVSGQVQPFPLLITTNGGHSWHWAGSAPRAPSAHLDVVSARTAWDLSAIHRLADGTWVVLRTPDGGRHWISVRLPVRTFASAAFDSQRIGWAAPPNTSPHSPVQPVYETTDGGQHWHRLPLVPSPPASLAQSSWPPEGGPTLYPGKGGTGVWARYVLSYGNAVRYALYHWTGHRWQYVGQGTRWSQVIPLAAGHAMVVAPCGPCAGNLPGNLQLLPVSATAQARNEQQLARIRATHPSRMIYPSPGHRLLPAYRARVIFLSKADGWAWTTWHLWQTTDGGKSWQRVPMPSTRVSHPGDGINNTN